MGYDVFLIDSEACDTCREKYGRDLAFSAKADIGGICVEMFTNDRDHTEMWTDNFYSMSDHTRSHARLFCIKDSAEEMRVLYEPTTCTAFLFNFEYYGWVKSIALGLAGNILEEEHGIYSIHGAAVDVDGTGVSLIAPSKTGKTTQSWGLLRMDNAHLISDDWYFVRMGPGRPPVMGSEKNCYIDADIGDVWTEFRPLVKNVKFDRDGRGIANVRWVTGENSVIGSTFMKYIIMLKRDHCDPVKSRKLDAEEALEYLCSNDFCNPHQISRTERKMRIRIDFFRRYLSACDVYLVNTTGTPNETQDLIRGIIGACRHEN